MDGTVSLEHASAQAPRLAWALRFAEREWLIAAGAFVLGRGPEADLQLDDESVSRRHALFRVEHEPRPCVEDLGSRNGTFVNDRRIAGRVQLEAGDVLALGACRFELVRSAACAFRRAPITRRLPHLQSSLPPSPLAALSPRERELFALLARGLPQREIAEHFGLSVKTVETHRTRIGHKLGLRSRAELIRCALETGILRAE